VVIGSGASGLPASIIAKENGASVILVEANRDIGGHAAVCTGNIPLGGGTRAQKEAGIVDSPDILFKDLTDWSVGGGANGAAEYRFNDRDIVRAFADNNVFAYDFLVDHGLLLDETGTRRERHDPGGLGSQGHARGRHGIRALNSDRQTGGPRRPENHSGGIGLVRPLEAAARKAGRANPS
jgi:succinate dehydrogenase/fumarate reductase flavoprotein subunit